MNEQQVFQDERVLPQYLVGGIAIFFLLLTSLLKQDLLLRIAVYGPILTGAFAMLLMVAIIDARHGLSGAIESRLKTRFFRLSDLNSNLLLLSILFMLSYNFFWIARLQLESSNVHWFSLSLFLTSILLGLVIGRMSLSLLHSSGLNEAKRMLEAGPTYEEMLEESHYVLSCLANNARHKLTASQKQLIHDQKNRCYEHIQNIVNRSESFEETLSLLQRNTATPSGFYTAFISIFNPVMKVEVSRFSNQASPHEQRVLDATVYLDATSFLLYSIVDKNGSSDDLVWALVNLLSNMVDAASFQLTDASEGTSMMKAARLPVDDEAPVVRLFTQTLAQENTFPWDPILITVIKKRVTQAFAQLEANEEFNLLDHERLSMAPTGDLHSILFALVSFIYTYDTNGQLMSKKSFNDAYFSESSHWNFSDASSWNSKKAHGLLSSAIPMKRYTLIQHLLFCMWVIAQNLDSKE